MPLIHSLEKRKKAINFRENGRSLRRIAKELSISVSTAQLWTKDILLSENQKKRIVSEHRQKLIEGRAKYIEKNKAQRIKHELGLFNEAKNEISIKKSDSFFMIGLALYWAEGFKKDHSLGFINSDPAMIQLFLKWLKVYGEIDPAAVRLRLQIHEVYRPNTELIQTYWSEITEIPLSQFQQPFYQVSKSKSNFIDPLYKGMIRIRVVGTRTLFVKILGWLEGIKSLDMDK